MPYQHAALTFVAGRGSEPRTERGVQRDAARGGVEMHFDRVVARLAVNVDGAGEAGATVVASHQ